MAKERDGGCDSNSTESMYEEGRGLPITDTSTPMPEVKPPKQSSKNSDTNKEEE